jgi:hypothetical protein
MSKVRHYPVAQRSQRDATSLAVTGPAGGSAFGCLSLVIRCQAT